MKTLEIEPFDQFLSYKSSKVQAKGKDIAAVQPDDRFKNGVIWREAITAFFASFASRRLFRGEYCGKKTNEQGTMPDVRGNQDAGRQEQDCLFPKQLCSTAERSVDLFTSLADPHKVPVHLVIRSVRVLVLAIGLALGLGAISSVMIRGVRLKELSANDLTDTDKSAFLDRYKTYTGVLVSLVSMPFQQMIMLLMPVFFLCFSTSAILNEKKSFFQAWAPVGATIAAALLIGQGMNAVNVQFGSLRVEFIIQPSDLRSSLTGDVSFVVTNITNSSRIAGIPSTETISRSAIRTSSSDSTTTCTQQRGWTDTLNPPEASIRYGFTLNSWLQHLLPTSVNSEKTIKFSVIDTFTSESVSPSVLDAWKTDEFSKIFSYGVVMLLTHYLLNTGSNTPLMDPQKVYSYINTSDVVQMVDGMQEMVRYAMNPAISEYGLHKISIYEVTVELLNFQLSPQVENNSATFELPVDMETMQNWVQPDYYTTHTTGTDFYTEIDASQLGNEHALLLTSPTALHDEVRVMRLCAMEEYSTIDDIFSFSEICDFTLKSAVLIYSFSQHITMDEATIFTDGENTTYRMKNHRKIYSVTIGKLSWEASDLAKVYDAKCGSTSECNGLYFPLSNINQHVIVGDTHIPSLSNVYSSLIFGEWPILVASRNEVTLSGSKYHADLIYPPIYPTTQDSLPWNLSGEDCAQGGSGFINDVIQRHIYSKDPVQPAYTAGLFWLFQNAALHNIENLTNSTNQNPVKLALMVTSCGYRRTCPCRVPQLS